MDERWPRLLEAPTVTGVTRATPEDFRVEEIPAYLPCGQGEHLMIELEKRELTTDQVVRALAHHLGINPAEVGTAGLKDRDAVTRQWLSVPAGAEAALESFHEPGVQILSAGRHTNKLKTGHLRANRFTLRIRELPAGAREALDERCGHLLRRGVPNYFGPQRFGRGGDNEAEGRRVLQGRGRRHDRRGLRFVLNAVQSGLFNDVLAVRLKEGLFSTVLAGDVLIKADTGGRFLCEDPAADQPRADRFELHASGPMFGPKMAKPTGRPAQMERQVLEEAGLDDSAWKRFAKLTSGARRPLRVLPEDFRWTFEDQAFTLDFLLPPGAYATALLRELIQLDEPANLPAADG